MKRFRNAIFITAVAVTGTLPFYEGGPGALAVAAAQQRQQVAKVKYAPIPGGDYKIDPAHSIIGFAIRHLEINWVEGRFKDFAGTIHFDDKDVTKSSVEFTAKVESVDTGVAQRDAHLRTKDFFEVEKYPEMSFKSTGVEKSGRNGYALKGDFTLKGVTKQVMIPFTLTGSVKDPWGNTRFGVEAHLKIDRRDYNITYGNALPAGGLDVGNEVTINLQLEALQPGPKQVSGK